MQINLQQLKAMLGIGNGRQGTQNFEQSFDDMIRAAVAGKQQKPAKAGVTSVKITTVEIPVEFIEGLLKVGLDQLGILKGVRDEFQRQADEVAERIRRQYRDELETMESRTREERYANRRINAARRDVRSFLAGEVSSWDTDHMVLAVRSGLHQDQFEDLARAREIVQAYSDDNLDRESSAYAVLSVYDEAAQMAEALISAQSPNEDDILLEDDPEVAIPETILFQTAAD